MIIVSYDKNFIVLTPENIDDNEDIINYVAQKIEDIRYKNNEWYIKDEHLKELRKVIMPVKKKIKVDISMKNFVNQQKNTLIIYCDIIKSKITGENIPYNKIKDKLRYFWKPAIRDKRFQEKKWDGYISLFDKRNNSFPTGLLYMIEEILQEENIPYKINYLYEQRPKKRFNWVVNDGLIPDQDQVDAVEAAYQGLRGVIKAPTGFGKTAIFAKKIIAAHGVSTLFIANKKALLDDAAKEFLNGIDGLNVVGEIKEGTFNLNAPVIVATIQSLNARLKDKETRPILKDWLNNICKFVLIDETQAVGTKTWNDVLNECHAPLRIGMSATPTRTDGAKIQINAQTGPPLFVTSAQEQIEKGRLCELDIRYQVFNHNLYNEKDADIEYHEAYKYWIVENTERNKLIINHAIEMTKEGRFVLVLVRIIDHGHILKDMLIREGVDPKDVRFVFGKTKNELRKKAIEEFRKGSFKILIGSTIFDAGVNIPVISGIVLAGAGSSSEDDVTLIQKVGRGARTVDYKDILGYLPDFMNKAHNKVTKVVDILDENIKFFTRQSWNRYKILKEEFGAERVSLLGKLSPKIKKDSQHLKNQINDCQLQLELLGDFKNDKIKKKDEKEILNKAQQELFSVFKRK